MPLADPDGPSLPQACALAVALPLSRSGFDDDLAAGPRMDYSRQQILKGRDPEIAWLRDGEPISRTAQELLHIAQELGVLVAPVPTLDDIAALFRGRSNVTLVAHWKGAELRRGDFLAEPSALIERLHGVCDNVSGAIRVRLPLADVAAALGKPNHAARSGAMAELLNRTVIDSDEPLPGLLGSGREIVYRPWLQAQHRRLLDEIFSDLLSPGNRIELRDGLHPASALALQIGQEWAGVIDLALCNSAVAATTIKAGNSARRVVFNDNQVVPQVRLRVLRELYRRLAGGGRNYTAELRRMIQSLSDLGDQIR